MPALSMFNKITILWLSLDSFMSTTPAYRSTRIDDGARVNHYMNSGGLLSTNPTRAVHEPDELDSAFVLGGSARLSSFSPMSAFKSA